jgi:hypothetical protein
VEATKMATARVTGRRGGTAKEPRRDAKLTIRLTRAERKHIRAYAVECELEINELVLRLVAADSQGFYTVNKAGPRLAKQTVPPAPEPARVEGEAVPGRRAV